MTAPTETKTLPRLKQKYRDEVVAAMREQYKYGNPMQIPGLVKVVVNMGVGEAARDAKLIDGAVRDLATITGQKPLVRRATKSIAQFKLREGMPIGAKVTLRGDRMWEFLDRLINIALPRVRDFRGVSAKAFDGRIAGEIKEALLRIDVAAHAVSERHQRAPAMRVECRSERRCP